MTAKKAYIKGVSSYFPQRTLTNEDLFRLYPQMKQAEVQLPGITKRHISAPEEIGSDVAFQAAENLFKEHDINRDEIDFLLFCTQGLDYKAPVTACILQQRLSLSNRIGAMDIPMGCTGFVYGLSLGKALIESGQARNVLLLTADVPTKVIHPEDRYLRIIFGDGGAATLLSSSGKGGEIGSFVFGTDGEGAKNLIVRHSGLRESVDMAWLEKYKDQGGLKWGRMEMNGVEVFTFAIKKVPTLVQEVLDKSKVAMKDIDLFIFHQANAYLLEVLRKKIKIPQDKFFINIGKYGNTVSATIPIALKEAQEEGRIKKGYKVMLVSFGIGYSWSGTIVNY